MCSPQSAALRSMVPSWLIALALVGGGTPWAARQNPAAGPGPAAGQNAVAGPPSVAAERSPVLDPPAQLMLIRNSLTLVNHGNLTGNYTVLRDLASPNFRQRNTAADLAATFANLRQQKLDLSPILVIDPQLTQPPGEIAPGRLQLVGIFPTHPKAVQFALVFQRVEGGWMIDEVALRVAAVEPRPPGQDRTFVPQPVHYR